MMKKTFLLTILLALACTEALAQAGKTRSVDLGLSVRWADRNVGAASPTDFGNYFAWGEPKTRHAFFDFNSNWHNKTIYDLTNHAIIDLLRNLQAPHDPATVHLGKGWRTPTDKECEELCQKCRWTWTTMNGVKGMKVTGRNGKSIFLPAAGYTVEVKEREIGVTGRYWTATAQKRLGEDSGFLYFFSTVNKVSYCPRYPGYTIRAVCVE